jgi:hypothetical protein
MEADRRAHLIGSAMPTPQLIVRTWRLHAFTDYGAVPRIEWLRETRKVYEDGDHKQVSTTTVARTLAEIAATPIPGGPITCTTYGDLFNAVGQAGHDLADEDDARAAVAEEAARRAAAAAAAQAASTPPA